MPLSGARYRVKTTSTGKRIRLAFRGNHVVETKNLDTGAMHTPQEFAADRARARQKRGSLAGRVTALRAAGHFGAARR